MDIGLLGLPIGLILLYFGSEWLVDSSKKLAILLGISPFVVGLTIVAFGSSSPEAITSVLSVDSPNLIVGNVVGSNIANVGVGIALSALIAPIISKYSEIKIELIFMMISLILIMLMSLTGTITLIFGIILVAMLFIFLFVVYNLKKDYVSENQKNNEEKPEKSKLFYILVAILSLFMLYVGADVFINASKELASMLGISDLIIGLFVVAIGTSLPEICISVISARKGENDILVANIVGSIIFNSLFVMGIGAILVDIPIANSVLIFHIPIMILMGAILFALVKLNNGISKFWGFVILAIYAAYIAAIGLIPDLAI